MWIALFVRMLETAYHTTGSLGGEWENCVGAGGKPLVASIVATDAELASTARVCGRRAVHKLRERLDQLSRAVARCSGPGIAGSARSSIGPSGPSGHASDGRSTGFWAIASSHVLLRSAQGSNRLQARSACSNVAWVKSSATSRSLNRCAKKPYTRQTRPSWTRAKSSCRRFMRTSGPPYGGSGQPQG